MFSKAVVCTGILYGCISMHWVRSLYSRARRPRPPRSFFLCHPDTNTMAVSSLASTYMHVARHVDSRVGISRDRDRPMRIRSIDRSGIGTPRIACTWPGQVGDVYFFRFASRLEAPFCCWFCVSFDLPFAGSCHHPGFIVRRRHCFNYVTTVSWMNLSRNFVIKKFE